MWRERDFELRTESGRSDWKLPKFTKKKKCKGLVQACSFRYWWDEEIWSRKCSVTGYCVWRLTRQQKRRIWQILKVIVVTKNVFCPDNFPHKTIKIWRVQNNPPGTCACIYLMATAASYWRKLYRVMAKVESKLSFSQNLCTGTLAASIEWPHLQLHWAAGDLKVDFLAVFPLLRSILQMQIRPDVSAWCLVMLAVMSPYSLTVNKQKGK